MKRTTFIICQVLLFVTIALVGKVAFLWYNADANFFTLHEAGIALLMGLPLDIAFSFMLMIPAWFLLLPSFWWKKMPVRMVIWPYLLIATMAVVIVEAVGVVMYSFWKFNLDASIFSYASSPGEVGSCVPVSFLVTSFLVLIASLGLAGYLSFIQTPQRISKSAKEVKGMILMGLVMLISTAFCVFRGDSQAFHSEKIFLNHAAVNPPLHFASSSLIYSKPLSSQFLYMDPGDCDSIFRQIFPAETEDIQDTLLRVARPNVLTIQLEGCGATFIETLGGLKGVCPELCRWMQKGVNFTNAYATSFRTDRGTVSALSGYVSYPTTSLMLKDDCLEKLPSLALSLKKEGYSTTYMYGGDIHVMNKVPYFNAAGMEEILSVDDMSVPTEERDSWGANDSISLQRLMHLIHAKPVGKPWYIGYQTLSSHEPWVVNYNRFQDPVQNAFAYTDHHLGAFLDSLSQSPLWDNLVVVVFADHGITYNVNMQMPEFFHIPLLIVGGAVKEYREINTLIAQNDIAATILSQLGIGHQDFPWSRNVFSKNYTYPFVYCNYPAGVLFKDAQGETMTDLQSGCVVNAGKGPNEEHKHRMCLIQTMLQKTYSMMP